MTPPLWSILVSALRLRLVQFRHQVLTSGVGGTATRIVEVPKDPSRTHPYRRKELVQQLNNRFGGTAHATTYDVHCVIKVHDVRKRSDFFYQGAVAGSPAQYSDSFLDWLVTQYGRDNEFFAKARQRARTGDTGR